MEPLRVNHNTWSGGIVGMIQDYLLTYKIKVCGVYSFKLPHQGNSNEYKKHTLSR